MSGNVRHGAGIAVLSGLMFLLVLSRLWDMVRVHQTALARERGLRTAGAALVAASDTAEVEQAVGRAVAALLPPLVRYRMVLDTGDVDSSPVRPGAGWGVALRYTSTLGPALAGRLGGFDVTMVVPLTRSAGGGPGPAGPLAGGPAAAGRPGTLYVAAAESALVSLEGVVEVIAAQTALALHRVALTGEVNRRRSEEYFRTLVCHATDVIVILGEGEGAQGAGPGGDGAQRGDPEGRDHIRYASPSAGALLGTVEIVGRPLLEFVYPDDRDLAGQYLNTVFDGHPVPADAGWRMLRGDTVVEVEASFQDLRAESTVGGVVVTIRDVTEQRRMAHELTHRAFHDSLTGLPNRALFTEVLNEALIRADRAGHMVGVLFLDLDDFKVVNDTLGHLAGDDLLRAVSGRLLSAVGPQDTVARFGGDEFAAILEQVKDVGEIDRVATRVAEVLGQSHQLGEHTVGGKASIGVATTAEAAGGDELMLQADLALHAAKSDGKGAWRRFQPALHAALLERMRVRNGLEAAVANGEFVVHYQPIVDLAGGATVGFEALVRWLSADQGLVPPGNFIDVAEESGIIVSIGGWVLRESLAAAARWPEVGPAGRAPYVSVNVSARQFRTPGFVDEVLAALDAADLPSHRLLLEITESLLLRDDEGVCADLRALRARGIRIAIDDFGTGYSSLSYLRRMPIDVVKIDRSFTESVASCRHQRALVEGIVRLASTLDLQVIAEGIENIDDRCALADMGCPMGQGYLFSPPVDYGDVVRWLDAVKVAV